MKRIVFWTAALAMVSVRLAAYADELPQIFIPPLVGSKTEIKGWRDDMGNDLAVLIAHELARRKLTDSHAMTIKDSPTNADCILLGSVSRFGVNINNSTQSSSLEESSGNRTLWIYWHLIDLTEDGRGVVAGRGLAKGRSERGEKMIIREKDYAPGAIIRLDNLNFSKSSLGIATFEAVSNLVNAIKDGLPTKERIARHRSGVRPSVSTIAVQIPVPPTNPVVELRPVPVTQVPAVEEKPAILGKVVEGSSADFVMLDKGKKDGVKPGAKFSLEDNGVSKGQGEITEVEVGSAVGKLRTGNEIKPGWSVKIFGN